MGSGLPYFEQTASKFGWSTVPSEVHKKAIKKEPELKFKS